LHREDDRRRRHLDASNNHQNQKNKMNKTTENNTLDTLVDDARALLGATANVAEDKVIAARQRLSEALDSAKGACARLKDRAMESSKVADKALHEYPYQAIGIALGVGVVLGLLASRRN
jgi:ElaB/YqjD/DUF883 family membrane-anchored ribosome-binding protein